MAVKNSWNQLAVCMIADLEKYAMVLRYKVPDLASGSIANVFS